MTYLISIIFIQKKHDLFNKLVLNRFYQNDLFNKLYLIDFIGIATHCFVAEKRLGWGPGGRAACSH